MMKVLLLIFSTLIYASFGWYNLIYILISALSTYFVAKNLLKIKHKKFWIFLTIFLNIGILFFFKLVSTSNFIEIKDIIVPLGISYYTFHVVSYLLDVCNNKIKAETKALDYLLYIMYIPYLFLGPIMKYSEMKSEFQKKRKLTINNLINGFLRIAIGVFKKFVIANRISILVNLIVSESYPGFYVLLALIFYSIQIYADFSGGIDIVIGFSNILDIKLIENFEQPYFSTNTREFWRRWHISLSRWFKDYVYIPLGGSRKGKLKHLVNVLIVFILSGLWHGIKYLPWGLANGILVLIFSKDIFKFKILNRILNYLLISLTWIFFIYPTMNLAFTNFATIFTNFNILDVLGNLLNLGLDLSNIIVLLISIIMLLIYDFIKYKNLNICLSNNSKIAIILFLFLLTLVFGVYGIGFNAGDFIYSKF